MLSAPLMMLIATVGLLFLWPLLLWPAVRLTGLARIWIAVVAGLGALAAGYVFLSIFVWWPTAAIRLDILAIGLALWVAYASAASVLFVVRWRKTAALLALAAAILGGVMTFEWMSVSHESSRLSAVFREQNALLFAAKFRDRATYDAYFGAPDGGLAPYPTGHWQVAEQSNFSRLIINAEGRAWLFYRCGDTECHFGSEGSTLARSDGDPDKWAAVLEKRGVSQRSIEVTVDSPDRLNVEIDGRAVPFVEAPPPIDPSPAAETLAYLGPFSASECAGRFTNIDQIWVWRDGDTLHGVGVFATKLTGARADFMTPRVMGAGRRSGDGWEFAWSRDERAWSATLNLAGDSVALLLVRDSQVVVNQTLSPGAAFRDEVIELAPRTTAEEWAHWFDTVLVGHFAAGDLPPC